MEKPKHFWGDKAKVRYQAHFLLNIYIKMHKTRVELPLSLHKRSLYLAKKKSTTTFKQQLFSSKDTSTNRWFMEFLSLTFLELLDTMREFENEKGSVANWSSFLRFSFKSPITREPSSVDSNDIEKFIEEAKLKFEDIKMGELNKVVQLNKAKYPALCKLPHYLSM